MNRIQNIQTQIKNLNAETKKKTVKQKKKNIQIIQINRTKQINNTACKKMK